MLKKDSTRLNTNLSIAGIEALVVDIVRQRWTGMHDEQSYGMEVWDEQVSAAVKELGEKVVATLLDIEDALFDGDYE